MINPINQLSFWPHLKDNWLVVVAIKYEILIHSKYNKTFEKLHFFWVEFINYKRFCCEIWPSSKILMIISIVHHNLITFLGMQSKYTSQNWTKFIRNDKNYCFENASSFPILYYLIYKKLTIFKYFLGKIILIFRFFSNQFIELLTT